ncbi:cyclopropane-fatty-acyl-phospholipid synthase family protein [Clostridium sp. BJN0001]|uniref:SAM-dependent methyltransferase n=1 Tax=Clostridium sp. BJN0001 TaxID=2930219 RepID=UPI001FD2B9B5|nr:cyclopropane-fatty-acyl-phospholipid synthase family protein [Clostridium sp. BJN0001]
MALDKIFYKNLFKNLFSDSFELILWDGSSKIYGETTPKFKIKFNKPIPKSSILADPSIAFGEAYMNKDIEIDGNLQLVIESLYNSTESFLGSNNKFSHITKKILNNIKNSKENIEHHYDIGNDFYKLWLDKTMTYSCAYFKNKDDSLYDAQINKVDYILKKLNLKKGETLLDIGCGWGELVIKAAKEYKVKAVGITLSNEQYEKGKERIKNENLENLVDIKIEDYREIKDKKFDKIVSVGMLEHVGSQYLNEYFSCIKNLLNNNGLALIHCITTNSPTSSTNSWINKYIFPGGFIPCVNTLVNDIIETGFNLIDVENLRMHYAKTLEMWHQNFINVLPEVEKMKDSTFIRMWDLYLSACAASFKCGNINLHQFLFSNGTNNSLPLTREYMYK